jgi:hypothetical protein
MHIHSHIMSQHASPWIQQFFIKYDVFIMVITIQQYNSKIYIYI